MCLLPERLKLNKSGRVSAGDPFSKACCYLALFLPVIVLLVFGCGFVTPSLSVLLSMLGYVCVDESP